MAGRRRAGAAGSAASGRWASHARRLLGARAAALALADRGGGCRLVAVEGALEPPAAALALALCEGVAREGAPLAIADAAEELGGDAQAAGVAACLVVPLGSGGSSALGALCLLESGPRGWSPDDVALLEDLADVAAAGIASADKRRAPVALSRNAGLHEAGAAFDGGAHLLRAGPGGDGPDAARSEPFDASTPPANTAGEERLRSAREAAADATERALLDLDRDASVSAAKVAARAHPGDVDRMRGIVERSLADPNGDYAGDFPLARRDGEVRWIGEGGRVARDEAGRPLRLAGVSYDVTRQRAAETALATSEARLRSALANAPVALFEQDLELRYTWLHRPAKGFGKADVLGRTDAELMGPERAAPLDELKRRTLETGAPQSAEVALVAADGRTRHYDVYVEPRRDATTGAAVGVIAAAVDVTAKKRAEAQRELLVRELDHRIRNLFAVAGSVVSMCARRADGAEALARAARERFAALARAHAAIRDLSADEHGGGADLAELITNVLAPHHDSAETGRVVVEGPPLRASAAAAVTLTLILHELATNAAKYGALSGSGGTSGRLRVSWEMVDRDGDGAQWLELRWAERGGPTVAPPTREGFGSLLIRESVRLGLGGRADLGYDPEGLVARLDIPVPRLLRPAA